MILLLSDRLVACDEVETAEAELAEDGNEIRDRPRSEYLEQDAAIRRANERL
jgi:hypothetical protein